MGPSWSGVIAGALRPGRRCCHLVRNNAAALKRCKPRAQKLPAGLRTLTLLSPADPSPVHILNPAGAAPFLLVCDHFGRAVPHLLGDLGVPAPEWDRHIAWDIGIAGVCRVLSAALDATCIAQAYSRLVIDCNRRPGHPTSIPPCSDNTVIPGNTGLSPADRAARAAHIFDPYHQAIAAELDRRRAAGIPAILIAMHSFTSVYQGFVRPWHAGILFNRDDRLARPMLDLLSQEPGMVVGENEPYAVSDATDYTVPVHCERRHLPHLELEIRQDLIEDEAGQREWAERLARLLPDALRHMMQSEKK